MKTLTLWADTPTKTDNVPNCIYDIAYSPAGDQLAIAVGHSIQIYDTARGTLIKTIKETNGGVIHTLSYSYDGKSIATGTSLKAVVVWSSEGAGLIKYSHGESVQCVAYDPTPNNVLASCAVNDFGFYRPNKQKVDKTKVPAKVNVCAWSKDGVYLALGLANGTVTIRNTKGDEQGRIERPGGANSAVWGLTWVPSSAEEGSERDMLIVADWSQSLSFYNFQGKQVVKERTLDFDPIKVVYVSSHRDCKYVVVAGANRACAVFTLEGIRIALLAEQASWVWSLALRTTPGNGTCHMAVGTVGGVLTYYELQILVVHALFKSLYAYRVNMTDVKVQNLDNEISVCMKCRDLVKKIAISKKALAVQLPDKVLIYAREERTDEFKYRLSDLISQKFECSLLVMCTENLVVCQDNHLQSYAFNGCRARDWNLEANIRYIRSVGGMSPNEVLLAGLKDGQVIKIFLNNSAPMSLLKVPQSVRCLDLSLSHTKLAVIDDTLTLYVYDLKTQELLFQEPNAITVFWNTAFDDLISFSGVGELRMKANGFKLFSQKMAIHVGDDAVPEMSDVGKDECKPLIPTAGGDGDNSNDISSCAAPEHPEPESPEPESPAPESPAPESPESESAEDENDDSHEYDYPFDMGADEDSYEDHVLFLNDNPNFTAEDVEIESAVALVVKQENYDLDDTDFLSKGFVVGFNGSKVFAMHNSAVNKFDISLKTPVRQYTDNQMFGDAYKIGCLGIADADWTYLGNACVKGDDFDIAKKVFAKLNRIDIVTLIKGNENKVRRGQMTAGTVMGEVLACQGLHAEAAKAFKENKEEHRAVAMFADLRLFDMAQEYLGSGNSPEKVELMRRKADWAVKVNEFRAAADMYLVAGEKLKAIELMEQNGWTDMLLELGQKLEPKEKVVMSACADALVKLGQVTAAAEMYSRVGSVDKVLKMFIQTRDWEEVFAIAKRHPNLKKEAYFPYAQWLAESDRFAEAQKAFHDAGCPEEAFKVLEVLNKNAMAETRFQDASYYHWVLSTQYLDLALTATDERKKADAQHDFHTYHRKAVMYFCYNAIYKYMELPFTPHVSEVLFSMSKFLMHEFFTNFELPVSKFHILYTLVKQARTLRAYKLARHVLQTVRQVRVPPALEGSVDLLIIQSKADPFEDNPDLQPLCYRCSTTNPLVNPRGNSCINCFHPFIYSFPSFEVLPLVEFQLEDGISDAEAISLIGSRLPAPRAKTSAYGSRSAGGRNRAQRRGSRSQPISRWRETNQADEDLQVLRLHEDEDGSDEEEESGYELDDDDPFASKSTDTYDENVGYVPIVIGREILRTLEPAEVLICKWPAPLRFKFYKNCLPGTPLVYCQSCWMLFHADDFVVFMLSTGACPFCRSALEKNNNTKLSSQ